MAAQIADLEAAATALRGHLDELDAAVAEGFDSLFDGLRDRFGEVCGLLFPGGEGRLRAVEDEEGEAGIEVEVVPAGKRPRSLTLMSGGERSLVALAFLLSLAMARPAPFYLLDEVEAALDDVNLGRFLAVVTRLAEQHPVHPDHPPAAHRRGRRHALRRDDGRRGRLAGRRPAAQPRRGGARRSRTCGARCARSRAAAPA